MAQYILAIDQSPSGTKAILFDRGGGLVCRRTAAHTQYYPQPGWVEHDALEIYQKTLKVMEEVLVASQVNREQIVALAVTNQRETVLVWEKTTGQPVYHAVVWQCQRAGAICKELVDCGCAALVREKSGLVLSPYFSAPKIKWILDNVPGAREKAESGQLLCGTMDAWLVWNLTGGKAHATDFSNASRTLLFNIHELRWDPELLEIFTIPAAMLPEIRSSNDVFGYTTLGSLFSRELPISGVMGDSHAALFGQSCFTKGTAKATYGTGSSIMMNIGDRPLASQSGLVTSVAWGMDGRAEYVFEGNINCTGDTIQWLVEEMALIGSAKEASRMAAQVADNGGVYLVPAFVGLGAPYWDSDARASVSGLTRGTTKAHLMRAAEEAIAYQIKDVLDLMIREAGIPLRELRVDGGPTKDDFLMQFQADILDIAVVRNKIEELSALGSAYMAGLAVGLWRDKEEIQSLRDLDRPFRSTMDSACRERLYRGWKEAVRRTLSTF